MGGGSRPRRRRRGVARVHPNCDPGTACDTPTAACTASRPRFATPSTVPIITTTSPTRTPSRAFVLTYPESTSGYRFKVNYDSYGHLTVAKDGDSLAPFYTLTEADALGREVTLELGSGANRIYEPWGYDLANGRLELIRAGKNYGTEIQDLSQTLDDKVVLRFASEAAYSMAPVI